MLLFLFIGLFCGVIVGVSILLIKDHFTHKKLKKTYVREGYKRLSMDIPLFLHSNLKEHAIQLNCTMTDIVVDLLTQELLYNQGIKNDKKKLYTLPLRHKFFSIG